MLKNEILKKTKTDLLFSEKQLPLSWRFFLAQFYILQIVQ